MAIILRLTVSDYHRYCYSVSGKKSINRRIEGIYHTVNSIANDYVPIYKTNTREYTRIVSPIYGSVIQMEVGALCVGRIVNYEEKANVTSGTEKGKFEFGGSTVVVFVQNDKVEITTGKDCIVLRRASKPQRRLRESAVVPALLPTVYSHQGLPAGYRRHPPAQLPPSKTAPRKSRNFSPC